ncbi:BppU family phage baseplate upper protein [Clostridium sporogenes]|uniref:BppU family phage baseplate upper protein n=1 Tax=Clostridium sporogenes TaxID=1509 RepID=A0AAE4JU96_CLOSG|nr:BppU family phage baseplate upper protein [Clostridium sporogenes]MDS1004193.1 BppU family phage baseplate upper protein [Clostridium sporogenes]
MDKLFNLLIDTKRTGFNAVRGLKQGDNNSILNITLVQNSVPFNLSNCTVRINYKRPDNKLFLQMADVVNAIDGKVKINILTKALENTGEVKADLSIFDKDNRKITSATFSMFVDGSIYRNDYLEPEDLDLIQSIWVEEDKRIRAENERVKNEDNRKNVENARVESEENRKLEEIKRVDSENIRVENETGREKSETTRIENEKIRLENESKRVENEKNRITEESERVESENKRIENETYRQQGYTEIKNTIDDFSVCEEFDLTKEYKKYNRVVYNGSCCECLKDCTNIYPVNKEYWILIAQKGKDGLGSGNMHTDMYDKNQNGIVDKAESITDGFITYNVTDINNTLNTLNANDQNAREEIMDIKLKLKEKLAVDFINKSGIGFFDTFETNNYIESTTATWNKSDATVDFGSPESEQLIYQAVENSNLIELVGDKLSVGDKIKVADKLITIEEVL